MAVNHTFAPAFNAPVANSFRFVFARAPSAPDATVATVATVSYGSAPSGRARHGNAAVAPPLAAAGLMVRPSAATLAPDTTPGAPRTAQHRDAMAQPACSLDLAMPCRDAGGTEHRSAAPVTPITWRFAPAATSAVNASHEVPVVNWAWLADAASPGSAAAGACEEQLLWDLPPAFLEGGWATLGVRGHQRSCSVPDITASGSAPEPAPGPAPRT